MRAWRLAGLLLVTSLALQTKLHLDYLDRIEAAGCMAAYQELVRQQLGL